MRATRLTVTILLLIGLAVPAAGSDFVVVAVTGALEPADVAPGQQLAAGTRLKLEPWGRALVREAGGCGLTHVVAGLDDYVLTPSADCSAVAEPMTVAGAVQRGEAFAERVKETGSGPADELVSALANEPCVFLERVSEEGGGTRHCPSGYALRGMRCAGSWCDDKDLLCCPYLGGAPDGDAKTTQSRTLSEEFPNSLQSKRFFNGLTCFGPYCDVVRPFEFKSPRLVKAKQCAWSAWSSEQPGAWLDCRLGSFVAGLRCRDDYCGEVGLYCCQAQVE